MPGIMGSIDRLVETGGGDLIITPGRVPVVRKAGRVRPADSEPIPLKEGGELLLKAAPAEVRDRFRDGFRASFCADIGGKGRFLTHVFKERSGVAAVVRYVPPEPPGLGELGLPEAARDLARDAGGVLIVAGHAGSGKTTTLAAFADLANRERRGRLVTIEDPTEFLHEPKQCVVHQLELGRHFEGFPDALRSAVREGADAVLVGRVDDADTVTCALDLGLSGCTVLMEVRARNAREAVARLLSLFPPRERRAAARSLGSALRGVVAQALLPRAGDEDARPVAAFELFLGTKVSAAALAEKGAEGVVPAIQAGGPEGMVLLEESLAALAASGAVAPADAASRAPDIQDFRRRSGALGVPLDAERTPAGRSRPFGAFGPAPPRPDSELAGEAGEDRRSEWPSSTCGPAPDEPKKDGERPERRPAAPIMTRKMSRAEMLLSDPGAGRPSARLRSRVAAFEAEPAKVADPGAGGHGARKVLVVDDDPCVLELMTRMLEQAGAKVSAFAEPMKALVEIRDGRFDLAMFDVLMPDISGTELYDRALLRAPSLRERVLFISSQSSDDSLRARLRSRGCRLLRKPFGIRELMAAMGDFAPVAGPPR